ncbi:MAG TPA: polysaccharide biosynthesis/export family protein, partial [Armatimonadota bacterium]|nr:polysaccharide biosynthesis/export family protein [Armatimonadota bacterium]
MRDWTGRSLSRLGIPLTAVIALTCSTLGAQLGTPAGGGMSIGGVGVDMGQRLGPGDVVMITVQGEPEESGSFMVSPTGTLGGGPLTGRVQAAGLTLDQLRDEIVTALREFIRRPLVGVSLNAAQSLRTVHVGGTVATPGVQIVRFGGSVAEAVMAAGILPTSDLARAKLTR